MQKVDQQTSKVYTIKSFMGKRAKTFTKTPSQSVFIDLTKALNEFPHKFLLTTCLNQGIRGFNAKIT